MTGALAERSFRLCRDAARHRRMRLASPAQNWKLELITKFNVMKRDEHHRLQGSSMNNIIYIVGLIVVVLAVLSFLGLR